MNDFFTHLYLICFVTLLLIMMRNFIINQHVRAENDIFKSVLDEKDSESACSHGIDDELDYSDSITIKITKVKYLGEPSHWEFDMVNADWEDIASGTAPTFHGVVDMAVDMASNRNDLDDPEWSRFDANGGK